MVLSSMSCLVALRGSRVGEELYRIPIPLRVIVYDGRDDGAIAVRVVGAVDLEDRCAHLEAEVPGHAVVGERGLDRLVGALDGPPELLLDDHDERGLRVDVGL